MFVLKITLCVIIVSGFIYLAPILQDLVLWLIAMVIFIGLVGLVYLVLFNSFP